MTEAPQQPAAEIHIHEAVSRLTPSDSRYQPISDDQLRALMAQINGSRVKINRSGFSYVEAWDVKAALTRIFGYAGWSADVLEWREISREQVPQRSNANKMNWQIVIAVTMRLTIHQTGATYTEVATGTSSQPEIGASFDMAIKSAESFALKRAAINLGTQFGLSLYNNGSKSDIIRIVLAPGQERNIPWHAPVDEAVTEEEKARQAQVDNAFSVHARPGKGGHEDSVADEPDSFPDRDEPSGD